MYIPLSVLAIVSLMSCGTAAAAPDYRCNVERIHNAAGEGKDSWVHQERKTFVGKQFSVDRRTGVMSGALKNNRTEPQIIDPGSRDNSFKAIATFRKGQVMGSGTAVFTLIVEEHVDSPVKPFVFLSNDVVYFGTCKHEQ
jgi:hypothetical protein